MPRCVPAGASCGTYNSTCRLWLRAPTGESADLTCSIVRRHLWQERSQSPSGTIGIGQGPSRRRHQMVTPEVTWIVAPAWPLKTSSGRRSTSRPSCRPWIKTWNATNSLRAACRLIRRSAAFQRWLARR